METLDDASASAGRANDDRAASAESSSLGDLLASLGALGAGDGPASRLLSEFDWDELIRQTGTDPALPVRVFEHVSAGGVLASLRGLDEQDLEALYSVGHSLFEFGKAEPAFTVFQFLCINDHLNARNWLALGIAQVHLGRLRHALNSFGMGAMVGAGDARFPVHSAEVHLRLDDLDAARSGAELAAAMLAAAPDARLSARVEALLNAVRRRAGSECTTGGESR